MRGNRKMAIFETQKLVTTTKSRNKMGMNNPVRIRPVSALAAA
jgi:hypothetical protein